MRGKKGENREILIDLALSDGLPFSSLWEKAEQYSQEEAEQARTTKTIGEIQIFKYLNSTI